jgi:hypothetical protein
LDPKKFWSQIIKHNTKENNRIPLSDWNSYLKSIYEFPNSMETILIVPIKEEVFSLDDDVVPPPQQGLLTSQSLDLLNL